MPVPAEEVAALDLPPRPDAPSADKDEPAVVQPVQPAAEPPIPTGVETAAASKKRTLQFLRNLFKPAPTEGR